MAESVFLGSGGFLHQATVTLTNAQIKALPTVNVTIVAAPGENLINIVQAVSVRVNSTAAAYTNVEATAKFLVGTNIGGSTAWWRFVADSVLTFNGNAIALPTPGDVESVGGVADAVADVANQVIEIAATNAAAGDFTGGDAANTGVVSVTYLTLNVSTGLYV